MATCLEVLQEFQQSKRAARALYAGRAEAGSYEFEEKQPDVAEADGKADDEEPADMLPAAGDSGPQPANNRTNDVKATGTNSRVHYFINYSINSA